MPGRVVGEVGRYFLISEVKLLLGGNPRLGDDMPAIVPAVDWRMKVNNTSHPKGTKPQFSIRSPADNSERASLVPRL